MRKNVEAACRFLDYGYSEEGFTMYNFGKEGVSFDYINYKDFPSKLDLSFFGDKFPRWNEEVYKPKDGYVLAVSLSRFVRSHSSGPFAQSMGYLAQFLPYTDQLASIDTWVKSSTFEGQLLPRMYFTTEESKALAAKESDLKAYKDETLMGFLQGSVELNDVTWAEFQDNLKTMGLEEILNIRRAAYSRAKAR
jgi:putative aldouronate transport system substrate-binding protein